MVIGITMLSLYLCVFHVRPANMRTYDAVGLGRVCIAFHGSFHFGWAWLFLLCRLITRINMTSWSVPSPCSR